MKNNIRVSVICCAYNQEKYIEDALKGFVSQKTDFGFEVLVSDDASQDGTAEIIRRYEEQYPEIIKPVYFSENQYSKGINPAVILMKKAQGDYIAFCEGDDYWISEHKLKRQFDAMEAHPECDMCAHGALKVRPADKKTIGRIEPMDRDGILPVETAIDGGGDFIATNSLFFRRTVVDHPKSYLKYAAFDYAYQISGAERGGIVYLAEVMSAYRRGAKNSWTMTMMHAKNTVMIGHIEKMMTMLDLVNEETHFRYDRNVRFAKLKYEFQIATLKRDLKGVYSKRYSEIRSHMGSKKRLILYLNYFAPWSIKMLQSVKSFRSSKE